MSPSNTVRAHRTAGAGKTDQMPALSGILESIPGDELSVWDYEEKSSVLDEPVLYFDKMKLGSPSPRSEHLVQETPARALPENGLGDRSASPASHVTPPHWASSVGESSASSLRAMSLTEASTSSTRHISTPPDDRELLPRRPASQLGVSVGRSLNSATGRTSERQGGRTVSAPVPRLIHTEEPERHDRELAMSRTVQNLRPSLLTSSTMTSTANITLEHNDTSATIVSGDQGSRLRNGAATPGFAERAQQPPSTMRRNLSRFGGPARRAAPVVELEAEDAQPSSDNPALEIHDTPPLTIQTAEAIHSTSSADPVQRPANLLEHANLPSHDTNRELVAARVSSPLRISPPPIEEPFRPFDGDNQRAAVPDSKSFRLLQSSYVAHNSNPIPHPPQQTNGVHQAQRDQAWAASRPAPHPRHPDHAGDHAVSEPMGVPNIPQTVPDVSAMSLGGTQGKRTFLVSLPLLFCLVR